MSKLSQLSRDFATFQATPPAGFFIASNVLDPVLFLIRNNGKYQAKLGAIRIKRGLEQRIYAQDMESNWVAENGVIHPLPKDVSQVIQRMLAGHDPSDLTFRQLLTLQRDHDHDLQIEVDSTVWESAGDQAAIHDENFVVPGLDATLYPYQARGIAWMQDTLFRTGGVILADEMGLGKTIQIIGLLLLNPPNNAEPALVICPTTLIANWVRELAKFAPGLSMQVHRGAQRARLHRYLQQTQIVITTYDTVVNDHVLFKAVHWSYVVLDEAQAVKNPDAQRRGAVADLPRRFTIPVTGTPVENHLLDLWSLADIAIPGLLGTQSWFENQFEDTEESARSLSQITNPIILKRQVRDVASDLPERLDIEVPIELGDRLAREYDRVLDETLARYPTAGPLVATGQLQLFCAHPWLQTNDPAHDGWEDRIRIARLSGGPLLTPKLERTIELIAEAFANHRKVLIFANFNACNLLFKEATSALPEAFWGAINGSTPPEERQQLVDEFSSYKGYAVLVLNPRAAGAGLNITAATVVIHYTQVWNPAIEQQASARAHRRGQTEPVTIYHMFYVDTVEEVMMERAQRRRLLGAEAVAVTGQDQVDLKRALSLRPN